MNKHLAAETIREIGEMILGTDLFLRRSYLSKEIVTAFPEMAGITGFGLCKLLEGCGINQCDKCNRWHYYSALNQEGTELVCSDCLLSSW